MSNDTNQPILVLVRRTRNDKGYFISPVDEIMNPALCTTNEEIGQAILEMLNDENQARIDIDELMSAGNGVSRSEGGEEDIEEGEGGDDGEGDGDEEDGDGGIFEGVREAEDPGDQLLINILSAALDKGREISSRNRRRGGRRSTRRRK